MGCIGWRFAYVDHLLYYSLFLWMLKIYFFDSVVEMQLFLVTLLREFYISQADHHPQIKRARSGLMVPLVLGEEHKGTQLPLKITAIRNAPAV